MVEKWKIALKEFLDNYKEDDDVIGAILCGSYANGTYNENSDIDVQLILKNSATYQERGNTESNSYLIEYAINPKYVIRDYFKKQYENGQMPLIYMFAYGKIIYDLDGSTEELQKLALDYIDKPLDPISSEKLEKNNYRIWDKHDELKVALKEERDDFLSIYYVLLNDIYNCYCEYIAVPKYPDAKLYKILTDEEYRKKHHIFKLPEEEFIRLYLKCYDLKDMNVMYKNITKLIEYYYNVQGGFNIRTFLRKRVLD